MFQKIMRNKNLSPEAKAIYAYLCSFAGDGESCYPSVDTMHEELGMSKGRLSKYMRELISCGVVEKTRSVSGNLLSRNIYKITHNVEIVGNEISDHQKNVICENRGIEKGYIGNECSEIECAENLTPNNNNTNNNNTNNNSIKNTSVQTPENGTGIFIELEDGSFYDVLPDKLERWEKAYPDLDVKRELYRMASWCDANPTRRKTRRGIEKFINGWLNRSMNDSQGAKGEMKNNAAEPKPESKPEPEPFHVSSAEEIIEELMREGKL